MQTYQTIKRAVSDAVQGAKDAASEPASSSAADGPTPTDGAASAPPAPPAPPPPSGTIVIQDIGGTPISIKVDPRGIHVMQGTQSTTIPIHDVVPRGAVQLAWASVLTLLIVGWPISRAFVRWIDRRAVLDHDQGAVRQQLTDRIAQLERNLDTAAVEIERLAEVQRFSTRQLVERTTVPPLPTSSS